jgi:pectate lyase
MLLSASALLIALVTSAQSMAIDMSVVTVTKLSEKRLTRTDYEYVMSVTVKNGAQALTNASETLTAAGSGTTIVDASVLIGSLAANAQVTSSDTITIRQNTLIPFNQAALVWSPAGIPVVASSSSSSSSAVPNGPAVNLSWLGTGILPTGAALYDVDGYAALGTPVTGGGVISEDDPAYRKVYTPAEFIAALDAAKRTLASPVKVIEIMNDLNLGTLESGLPIAGIYRAQSTQAQLHPTLKLTGVSLIDIKTINSLTIFSRNGATIRHAEWNIKDATNLIIRNLKFDELWEWDEATKGDYDKNDWDYITLGDGTAANKVWIDHCTFFKSYDGIVDVKGGSNGVTISWSQILPGDGSNGAFVRAQMDYLEANQASMVMYKKLRDGGLTQDQITQVANTVKKGHLIGATAKNSENNSLQVTLHHNYYQDLQDRMPRLRGGDVQAFNILADSSNARAIKAWLDPILLGNTNLAKDFTGTGSYKFGITSNGTISTEDGVIEVANSLYAGVLTPLRNNQTDVNDPTFTGSVVAANTQHELLASEMPIASQQSTFNALGNLWAVWKGDSNFANSTLGPVQAPAKYLSFKAAPPSAKALHAPTALRSVLVSGAEPAGAGKISLTVPQWLNSLNANGGSSSSASSVATSSGSSSSVTSVSSTSSTSAVSSSSVASSVASSLSSASSVASSVQSSNGVVVATTNLPFVESFDGATTASLFTAVYKSVAADPAVALYFKTGGSPTIVDNALSLAGARLTIGNRPPRTNTTAADTTTNGDFDLSRPYRISFKVVAASGVGALQVYIDNNTTSSGNSKHGGSSRVLSVAANTLVAGQTVTITPAVGTSTSFIALRTESTASAIIDDLRVEYLDSGSSSSAAASSQASSASSVSSASSAASSVASSVSSAASSSSSSSSAPFVQPTQVYNLLNRVTPSVNEVDSYVDTRLAITFDAPPVLGTSGAIHIFKLSDDSLVDTIKLSGNTDEIGFAGQTRLRMVNTQPLRIIGNSLIITPHSSKLAYGTAYYVAIADGALTGATVNGTPFVGMGKNAGWTFTTKASAPTATTLTVDDNGAADFRTVQGAINHVMQTVAAATPVTINVNNGSYEELLYVRSKNNLTIKGESREGVVIHYTNNNTLNSGTGGSQAPGATSLTGGRSVILVESSDLLAIDNLTLKNTTLIGNGGQAEVIYFNSDTGRLAVSNANFISEQDTVQVKGYSWFYRSLIAGNVDFIWGGNRVALFEESEIRSLGDSRGNGSGGYILQARTVTAADKGFVFLNSRLTRGPGPLGHNIADGQTWLARSGGSASYFDNIVFINTQMDSHIKAAGWNTSPLPNPGTATATSGWREYGSTDLTATSLDVSGRSVVSAQLSLGDVINSYCSRAQIFSAFNGGAGWNPLSSDSTDCLNFVMSN